MNVNVAAMPNIFEILSREDYHCDVLKVSNILALNISFFLFTCISPQYKFYNTFSGIHDYFKNFNHFFIFFKDQDHVQKKAKPTKEKPTQELHSAIKIKSFVKRFKKIKFDPSSYCSSSCSQIVKEETIEDQPPCKMMKLEGGGQEPVTECRVDQEIVYELISDDELPDLEEGEPGGTLSRTTSRTTQTRPGGEVKKELELFSPESPTPESQWCSSPLGLNVEPIRVPLYEDVSSEEDNEPMFEDISSDSDYCKGRATPL